MALDPNSRYPTQTNAPTAAYPLGSARNITIPSDGTGTPWEEDIPNDLFGFQQELLDKAGIAASGNPDEVDDSQYYNAMRLTAGYPGVIVPIALNAAPGTLGLRLLLLDGSGILVASYPDLAAATYIGDPSNPTADAFYRANDAPGAVRNTGGAYLILPDFRGQFVRGLDTSGTIDPEGVGRVIGDGQDDAVLKHNHVIVDKAALNYGFSKATGGAGTDDVVGSTPTKGLADFEASAVAIGKDISGFANITGIGEVSIENRPVNVSVNWAIWF